MRDGSMDMGYGYDIDMATLRFFKIHFVHFKI